MYMIEPEDIERFTKLSDTVQWHKPWLYGNVKEQTDKIEYIIQKYWANKVNMINKSVAIFNSGFGFYSVPFCSEKGAQYIRLYDMDPTTKEISWYLNERYKPNFDHKLLNITFDYEEVFDDAHIYINTSCEHSYPMGELLKEKAKGKLCVMSGNNLTKRGHINLIDSIDMLKEQCQLSKIYNEDVMEFDYEDELGKRKYKQFFIIGVK